MIGKVKTTTQMIAVIYLMFEPTIMKIFNISSSKINPVTIVGDVLFGICVIMTVVSGLDYLLKNLNFLKES